MQLSWVGVQQVHSLPFRQSFCPAGARKAPYRKISCKSESTQEKAEVAPNPTRRLQSTEEERRQRPSKHQILDIAERDLEGFCSALPDDEESEVCWDAYKYFEEKKAEAEDACEVEFENSDGLTKPQCARLEQFEDFVRQMVGEGHIVNFVTTLQTLSHANKRRLAKDLEAAENGEGDSQDVAEAAHKLQDTLDHNTDAANSEQESSERRARVKDLFYAMDKDGNGKLDVGEFREAMRELGDEMSGTSVATILDAMDVHGFINLDQFVAIVEAEAIESHSADARLLRRLSKDPVWWTHTKSIND